MTASDRVQTIYKVLRILSLIAHIALIVGAAFTLLGGTLLLAVPSIGDMELIWEIIDELDLPEGKQVDFTGLGKALIAETVFLVSQCVVTYFQYEYYKHELSDGTPFTRRGTEEMQRVGILTMAVSFGGSVITAIVAGMAGARRYLSTDASIAIGCGLTLFLLSFVFAYATEQIEQKTLDNQTPESPLDTDTYNGPEAL